MSIQIDFTGSLAAGETLIIDLENETAMLDGTDVSSQIAGFEKVFELFVGGNTITYSDTEGSRTLAVTITHTPRWL